MSLTRSRRGPPADVEDDRLAGRDDPLARLVVRRRAVGPGRHDRRTPRRRDPRPAAAHGPRAATSASVRPTSGPAAIAPPPGPRPGRPRAAARPRPRPCASAARGGRRTPARTARRAGPAGARARTPPAARPRLATAPDTPTGDPRPGRHQRGRDERHRVLGLLPRGDLDRARCPGRARPRRRRSSRGATSVTAPRGGRDHEHRQALQRHRLVAREVPQVRPDADQESVQARPPLARAAPRSSRSA